MIDLSLYLQTKTLTSRRIDFPNAASAPSPTSISTSTSIAVFNLVELVNHCCSHTLRSHDLQLQDFSIAQQTNLKNSDTMASMAQPWLINKYDVRRISSRSSTDSMCVDSSILYSPSQWA
jgi:hypothetical protein